MREALTMFDTGAKKNPHVRLTGKDGGWSALTPLDAQPDPPNLAALKAELNADSKHFGAWDQNLATR